MRFRVPDYYDDFRCIAGDCRDSCCIGWEIEVDGKSLAYYQSIGGAFGERLRQNLRGGCFVLGEGERCPFLNRAGLCDIYTELGEQALCQICTDHPRFFEWFGDVKEGGLGLCCEAAAALILSRDLHLTEREIPDDSGDPCDPALLDFLTRAREKLLDTLASGLPYDETKGAVLQFALELQDGMDNEKYLLPEMTAGKPFQAELGGILKFLCTLETLDPAWQPLLQQIETHLSELPALTAGEETCLRRVGSYFLYRYFLKGVFDGEILSRVRLSVLAMEVVGSLWRYHRLVHGNCDFTQMADHAKAFSKELEYSEENIEAVLDAVYVIGRF